MRTLGWSGILVALVTVSCADMITLSDVIELQVGDDKPSAGIGSALRTDVYRESDGQLVVQVFNDGMEPVRDIELEIERVSRSGRRTLLGNASINRRIGGRSMDQTRTSVFVDKREVKDIEVRVTSADRTD